MTLSLHKRPCHKTVAIHFHGIKKNRFCAPSLLHLLVEKKLKKVISLMRYEWNREKFCQKIEKKLVSEIKSFYVDNVCEVNRCASKSRISYQKKFFMKKYFISSKQ